MSEDTDKNSFSKYLPALITAILAVVGLVLALTSFDGSESSWLALSAQVEDLGKAADQAAAVAVEEEDFAACVASESTAALAYATSSSLAEAAKGVCKLPAVSADVTACLPFAEKVAEGKDIPAAVELSIAPVMGVVTSLLEKGEESNTKAWAKGALAWLNTGKDSIIALIKNPSSGKLELAAVAIEGCTVGEDAPAEGE